MGVPFVMGEENNFIFNFPAGQCGEQVNVFFTGGSFVSSGAYAGFTPEKFKRG